MNKKMIWVLLAAVLVLAVAAAALVPGVLIRMAEIDPPNMEPQ